MRTRWIVSFIGVLLAFPACAASDSTDVVRDLASRVGPVVGVAVACRARSTAQAAASAVHAAAKSIEKTHDGLLYGNVSAAGATSLAGELMLLGPRFTNNVIVTQIVPAIAGRYFSTNRT